jgi:hypothetical protein
MKETFFSLHEKESFRGLSTLEIAKNVISGNHSIIHVSVSVHNYVPHVHNENGSYYIDFLKEDFLKKQQLDFEKIAEGHAGDCNVSLNSNVSLRNNDTAHLAIIDLAPPKSQENLTLIKDRFKEIIEPSYGGGFFIETGKSYQYLGENLISNYLEWVRFMADCLLTSVVMDGQSDNLDVHKVVGDYRYIGHSLRRNHTSIRLTTKGSKTFVPFVVDYI